MNTSSPQDPSAFPLDGPFKRGRAYRVRHSFAALRDSFTAGEVLIFDSSAWSRYDGITGFFFTQPRRQGGRVWDLADDADVESWRQLFEEMPAENEVK
ncbi:MAG: hypothetical protein J0L73_04650 [Verrucomicrobia bacterium]|nr:hypothetical protein [Verrucomicrobiota bacterium]